MPIFEARVYNIEEEIEEDAFDDDTSKVVEVLAASLDEASAKLENLYGKKNYCFLANKAYRNERNEKSLKAAENVEIPTFVQIDLTRGEERDHPDIDLEKRYLVKYDENYLVGHFSRVWYGLSFRWFWGMNSLQYHKPGTGCSNWQGIWELVEPEPKEYMTFPEKYEECAHTEHCDAVMGCKYGNEDCPVYLGYKPQSFPYYDVYDEEKSEIPRLERKVYEERRKEAQKMLDDLPF